MPPRLSPRSFRAPLPQTPPPFFAPTPHILHTPSSFVIGLDNRNFEESFKYENAEFGWFTILGVMGGVLGASYTAIVLRFNKCRAVLSQERNKPFCLGNSSNP